MWSGAIPSQARADEDLTALTSKALSFAPRQGVDYKKVTPAEAAKCSGKYEKRAGVEGFLVVDSEGVPLRWLADLNGDKKVDQWCYFLNGVEVYREMDTDFNRTADEYRWMGTAGMRWGVDSNEDGEIDRWKVISAEEITLEVVEAVRTQDASRFARLLVNADDLQTLGLGDEKKQQLEQRVTEAARSFTDFAKTQRMIGKETKWSNFGAEKPGLVPAGTDGSTNDVIAYENAVAIIDDSSGKPQQLLVGTIVQVGNTWKLADAPQAVESDATMKTGFFFSSSDSRRNAYVSNDSSAMQELVENLDKIDVKLTRASGDERVQLNADRADILEKLIRQAESADEVRDWIHQFADTVGAAAQAGDYPQGVDRLRDLATKLQSMNRGQDHLDYVAFRVIQSEYYCDLAGKDPNYAKVQEDYLKNLEQFVQNYPESNDAAEAMVQIGLQSELAGDLNAARKWYSQSAERFASLPYGKKAAGAFRRLNLEGQEFPLVGTTVDGKKFDLKQYRNQIVVIHCWASWCGPCKADMNKLRELQEKYAKTRGFNIVGINFDETREKANDFLKAEKSYRWAQLYDENGMESELATRLGAISLPITIVVDGNGKVISSSTHFSTSVEEMIAMKLEPPTPAPTKEKAPPATTKAQAGKPPATSQRPNGSRK